MVQLKIKDYNQADKDILFDVLYDALSKYCYSACSSTLHPIENCSECPGKKVCRDIHAALSYIYHAN